jgi:hypothetical protein
MTTHVMLDLETLGTRPGAVILAAAFVRFSDEAHCTLNLSIPDQTALGMEIDPDTHAWWGEQESKHPGAWAAATESPLPIAAALPYFANWLAWATGGSGDWMLWCHHKSFDGPLLSELYRRAGIACPFEFWRVRDTPTLYDLAGLDKAAYAVPPPHIALNDAIGQTRAANAALRVLAERRGVAPSDPRIVPPTGTNCSICREPQFHTVHGVVCANGHGGAEAAA